MFSQDISHIKRGRVNVLPAPFFFVNYQHNHQERWDVNQVYTPSNYIQTTMPLCGTWGTSLHFYQYYTRLKESVITEKSKKKHLFRAMQHIET